MSRTFDSLRDPFPVRRRVFPTRHLCAGKRTTRPRPIVLWRLHGDAEDLVCAAITTSFGYALGLTLGGELILLDLQPSLDHVVSMSERLERWLLGRGWVSRDLTPAGHHEE